MNKHKIKQLKKDLALTLHSNPGLELKYNGNIPIEVAGNYKVIDDKKQVLEDFDISVPIPKLYPNEFPVLIEKSLKIPRDIDRHINDKGVACVEFTYKKMIAARNGITISTFFKEYVHRYFCWQLLYEIDEEKNNLVEWAHDNRATIEYYCDLLRTRDFEKIRSLMTAALEQKRPSHNSLCICNSGKKYKRCHLATYTVLISLGSKILSNDYILFK